MSKRNTDPVAVMVSHLHASANDMSGWMGSQSIEGDLYRSFLGEPLGEGSARYVYRCKVNPEIVIKIERPGSFQNVIEFQTWSDVEFAKPVIRDWFAPVYSISPNGRVLIMRRCEPAKRKDFPDLVPAFLNDRKHQNFGMIDGRLVCLNYGSGAVTENLNKRQVKARWWNED